MNINKNLYLKRRIINGVNLTLSLLTVGIALFFLAWILFTLFNHGFAGVTVKTFTMNTPPPGSAGGLLNAIYGSLMMVLVATLIGTPTGIFAGTYLAEFGRTGWLAPATRFINDILLSAPSIVIGMFIYSVMVHRMGHYSGWAGAVALAVIALPVVVRTTENMLQLVPGSLREAAAALGSPQWKVVVMVSYRAARAGILTGVLLAVARILGETAPLLFTALNNNFMSTNMNGPMSSLAAIIFQFAMSPYKDWHDLAWAGALLITLFVLGLNVLARSIFKSNTGN
ncbi:MAG TPA: phosphate ABC transporter permease PstA [Methylophilaceae bacterium]|jgi:phosphate transport system permease protein